MTNGFSARYGQALSGLVNVVTREPDDDWEGRPGLRGRPPVRREPGPRARPMWSQAGGPVVGTVRRRRGGGRSGRLDADPVNAPAPTNPLDPRSAAPILLPHNSGEQWTGAGQDHRAGHRPDHLPGARASLRGPAPALRSGLQVRCRSRAGPAASGDLLTGHVQYASDPRSASPSSWICGWRGSCREFIRGELDGDVDYAVGALTGIRFHFLGEERGACTGPVAGGHSRVCTDPLPSTATPVGGAGLLSRQRIARQTGAGAEFGETRCQLDVTSMAPASRCRPVRGRRDRPAAGAHLPAGPWATCR